MGALRARASDGSKKSVENGVKQVLILSPRFPPVNAADHHRVRMMLPELAAHGWKATVLAVDPAYVEGEIEEDLVTTIPPDVEVIRVKAIPALLTRKAGIGSLGLRAYPAMRAAGDELLRSRRFDLVFASTTEFGLVPLARRWKRRFGVPYVVDLQDPWVNPYYDETGNRPPGGAFKHWATQAVARRQEGPTLRDAARIITVSPGYPEILRRRYPELPPELFCVIPFAGAPSDFEIARQLSRQRIFTPGDGRKHWTYAGTAPPGIRSTLIPFLLALRRAFDSGIVSEDTVRLHFVGTDYSPKELARNRVTGIAEEVGMGGVLEEHASRIPFLETLRCLLDSDALLLLGWDDPAYTASKVYPYILAHRPLLSVLHEESSANQVIRSSIAGVSVTFSEATSVETIADAIYRDWFVSRAFAWIPATSWNAFEQYTARSMTSSVARVFDSVHTLAGGL